MTDTVPAAVKVQESVEVPEPPVMDAALRVHAELFEVSATVPVNPLTGETVIVMVAVSPAFTVTLVVLAVIVKSVTLNGSQALVVGLLLTSPV